LGAGEIQNPKSKIQHVNLVVVRENTEGLYAGRERLEDDGATAIAERVITRRASERIARTAFELARRRAAGVGDRASENGEAVRALSPGPRPLVSIVHKANVLRETCGLFRAVALDTAREYPDVQVDELLVDTCALQLVQRPERFDVIVTTNLFGDILSDVACAWGGGLGLAASANIGATHALFEPVHGAAPDIAGTGTANPLAAISCAAMLLEHLGDRRLRMADGRLDGADFGVWARRVRAAVQLVLAEGPRTPDLGGDARTEDVTGAVIATL
jgi:homoisocitrate dehydrogenase